MAVLVMEVGNKRYRMQLSEKDAYKILTKASIKADVLDIEKIDTMAEYKSTDNNEEKTCKESEDIDVSSDKTCGKSENTTVENIDTDAEEDVSSDKSENQSETSEKDSWKTMIEALSDADKVLAEKGIKKNTKTGHYTLGKYLEILGEDTLKKIIYNDNGESLSCYLGITRQSVLQFAYLHKLTNKRNKKTDTEKDIVNNEKDKCSENTTNEDTKEKEKSITDKVEKLQSRQRTYLNSKKSGDRTGATLKCERKDLEVTKSVQCGECRQCGYMNREDGQCDYSIITYKTKRITKGVCSHFVDVKGLTE